MTICWEPWGRKKSYRFSEEALLQILKDIFSESRMKTSQSFWLVLWGSEFASYTPTMLDPLWFRYGSGASRV